MATNRAPIVGVFDDRALAEKAIEELYNSGVSSDRISYSGREYASNNIVSNLKNLFGGATESHKSSEIVKDLTNLGLRQDEAQYYAQEYEAGHTIIAVQPSEQIDNTMTILRSNGAHDFNSRANYEKIGGSAKGSSYTGTTTTGADAMAQRTDDSPTNVQPDTSTRFNQPTSAFDQSAATGSAPTSAYDQGTQSTYGQNAAVDNQTASPYDQSAESTYGQNAAVGNQTAGRSEQGTADTIQQQTNYNRDANIGTPPTSDYDQGVTYSGSAGSIQQPGYGNAPMKDQPTSAYDQPANTVQSGSYQQQPGFTQAPDTQDYTTPNRYEQRDINAQNQPDYDQSNINAQNQPDYSQRNINAQYQPDYGQQGSSSQYPDTEARDQDSHTDNPFKKIVRHLKGEHDPDADYNREQRHTDPDQNF